MFEEIDQNEPDTKIIACINSATSFSIIMNEDRIFSL